MLFAENGEDAVMFRIDEMDSFARGAEEDGGANAVLDELLDMSELDRSIKRNGATVSGNFIEGRKERGDKDVFRDTLVLINPNSRLELPRRSPRNPTRRSAARLQNASRDKMDSRQYGQKRKHNPRLLRKMTPHRLIDSHIHLWPAAEANANQHGWMKGSPLAKQYSIDEYLVATGETNLKVEDRQLKGVVYIETDRRLQEEGNIEVWTGKTLDELRFLRRIAEGTPKDAEGHNKEHSGLLLAIVAWAPIHRGQDVFQKYLELAREVAGPKTFARIKAFRFLLQGIRDEKMFRDITLSESTIQTLKSFKRNGNDFAFDVGVDQRQGGISQLETAVEMIKRVHEGEEEDDKVVFVLSLLTSPKFSESDTLIEY
ncbi:MAG: hypothetical protein M1820_003193 [Bogoriella megaspora]|nr:MAG: hypothetical protein M1820_003193 [Bogoriella megaspora]